MNNSWVRNWHDTIFKKEDQISEEFFETPKTTEVKEDPLQDIKRSVNRVASTEDGLILFRELAIRCGFKTFNGSLDPNHMLFNEGRRRLYGEFRQLLDIDHINKIEQEK